MNCIYTKKKIGTNSNAKILNQIGLKYVCDSCASNNLSNAFLSLCVYHYTTLPHCTLSTQYMIYVQYVEYVKNVKNIVPQLPFDCFSMKQKVCSVIQSVVVFGPFVNEVIKIKIAKVIAR